MDIFANILDNPTDLCFIMSHYGSDKGHPDNNTWHTYTRYYSAVFSPVRNQPLRVFELGIGSINPNIRSNMGPDGKPGASLRGWKQFFPNAKIFGADIDADILFQEDRIETFCCDQTNVNSVSSLWDNPSLSENGFDIIIEDGLHIFESNVLFFENSFHKLNVGGVFIIEDICDYTLDRWNVKIFDWEVRFPNMEFRLYSVPSDKNPHDNRLIIAQRKY